MLENIAWLAKHVESLRIELEALGKQTKKSVKRKSAPSLMSENGNIPQDDKEKQNRLEGKLLHAFSVPDVKCTSVRQRTGKSRRQYRLNRFC